MDEQYKISDDAQYKISVSTGKGQRSWSMTIESVNDSPLKPEHVSITILEVGMKFLRGFLGFEIEECASPDAPQQQEVST